jgi:hypothetical protein
LRSATKCSTPALVLERNQAAERLAAVEVEAAKVQGDRAGLAVDTGPVRFPAALLATDADALMRVFILIIAIILDPVAAVLLVAAGNRRT